MTLRKTAIKIICFLCLLCFVGCKQMIADTDYTDKQTTNANTDYLNKQTTDAGTDSVNKLTTNKESKTKIFELMILKTELY
ncbi:MAG TPA: hypothetical protein VJY12_07235 [Dysgonamonadaceae bacterium]|jgi:hypothetical protein|nr:hypothetical protein [Bacillota bacterium]NLN52049.1 hypothetical protein [Clostridiaceae bacterium]HKM45236.1 hypothetical protein [Dysgonamonadaceae bacterium]